MADTDPLLVEVGVTLGKLEKQMARAEARMVGGVNKMERSFQKANRQTIRSFNNIGRAAGRNFSNLAVKATAAVGAIVAIGAAIKSSTSATDAYRQIENRLEAIGQYGDEAGEKLLAAAVRSRTGVEAMSQAVLRFEKATGDGFDTAIRRVESLNKILAVGGATTQEVTSIMTQLGQSLTSGQLNGDELRSLREAAPVEVLDALAKAAGSTRSELKQLGEDGKLTSEIITRALDELASEADAKFGKTTQTVSQALTNVGSAFTVFIGRLDEGLGSQDAFVSGLQDMAEWLQANVDEAEEFGRSVRAVFQTVGEYVDAAKSAIAALEEQLGVSFDLKGPENLVSELQTLIGWVAELAGALSGAGAVAQEVFSRIGDAVAGGLDGPINLVIDAVEVMVNSILAGLKKVAGAIDAITGAAAKVVNIMPGPQINDTRGKTLGLSLKDNKIEGTNLAEKIGEVDFGGAKVEFSPQASGGAFGDIYAAARDSTANGLKDGYDNFVNSISDNKFILKNQAALDDAVNPGERNEVSSSGGGGAGDSGGKSGSKKGSNRDLLAVIRERITAIQREAELLGMSTAEAAKAKAVWSALDAAKKAGIPITDDLRAKIEAEAEALGRATAAAEANQRQQEAIDKAIEDVSSALANTIVNAEDFGEAIGQIFRNIAQSILQAGIQSAITSVFDGLGGGVGGGKGGLLGGAIIPGILHDGGVVGRDGYGHGRAVSSSVFAGARRMHNGGIAGLQSGEVPAILQRGEVVIPKDAVSRMGRGGDDRKDHMQIDIVVQDDGKIGAIARSEAANVSVNVMQAGAAKSNEAQRRR